jgi:hypothetical protein
LFAGAALYVTAVEHPVRRQLETKTAALQWASSYKRATLRQAPLALSSLVTGTAAWLLGASVGWLVAALLIGAVVPYTFIAVMPTNRELLAPDRDLSSVETRQLLHKWGRLHAVRTALGFAASVMYLWLLSEPDLGAMKVTASSAEKASYDVDRWLGQWNGPEGTFLRIAGGDKGYEITIRDLDGPAVYRGAAVDDRIEFERSGVTESLRATDGAGTGMKWLGARQNCLTVRRGEGYCRD